MGRRRKKRKKGTNIRRGNHTHIEHRFIPLFSSSLSSSSSRIFFFFFRVFVSLDREGHTQIQLIIPVVGGPSSWISLRFILHPIGWG